MIDSRISGSNVIVTVRGELDLTRSDGFRRDLDAVTEAHPEARRLILCMDRVTFIDSSGLGIIFGTNRRLTARGVGFAIAGPRAQAWRALELLGVPSVIPVYDSLEQALSARPEGGKCRNRSL
ncbi:MAG: STAS domain-containing protein [Clostridia bacterium]|nr:STAS domain-containing protein [Clostridia bacterium]